MSSTKRLTDAFRLQFQWIPVLITDRSHHTSGDRKRSVLFAVLHVTFLLVLCGHFVSVMASWVLAFILQAGAMGLCVLHLTILEEYADRMNKSLELEHVINPLIIAEASVRCFACLQCVLSRSWLLLLAGCVEIAYDVYVVQHRSLLIDGTTIWKEVDIFRTDGRLRVAYQLLMIPVCILYLIFSIYNS
ncbi:putative Cornichon protein [Leishmania utingensis]|uniref:Cornichon protein n=1 Tax=Leishmania utingensis TaxID=653362 RepID=A0AAW3A2I9_9TRYP